MVNGKKNRSYSWNIEQVDATSFVLFCGFLLLLFFQFYSARQQQSVWLICSIAFLTVICIHP